MDFDDLVDIIKVILALLFIFGGSFAKLLRKLSEMQKEAQREPPPPAAEEAAQSWRYDHSESAYELEAEEAHEDEEDYDLRDELDTELDRDRLDDHEADDDLETHEESVYAEPDFTPAASFEVESLEAESFEQASEELVRESAELELMRQRIERQVQALQRRAPPPAPTQERHALHGAEVRVASFVRDAIVLDLLFRRKASNPLFRLR